MRLGVEDLQGWGGVVLNVLCPGMGFSFLSVHMWGFPRLTGTQQVCRHVLQGLRCFVGEKLPGLGLSLGPLALAQLSA